MSPLSAEPPPCPGCLQLSSTASSGLLLTTMTSSGLAHLVLAFIWSNFLSGRLNGAPFALKARDTLAPRTPGAVGICSFPHPDQPSRSVSPASPPSRQPHCNRPLTFLAAQVVLASSQPPKPAPPQRPVRAHTPERVQPHIGTQLAHPASRAPSKTRPGIARTVRAGSSGRNEPDNPH